MLTRPASRLPAYRLLPKSFAQSGLSIFYLIFSGFASVSAAISNHIGTDVHFPY